MKPITDKKLLNELPFHNILTKKPVSKPFTNRKKISELPFYERFLKKPNITKKFKIFKILCTKVYSRSVRSRDPVIQLYTTMIHVENKLKGSLNEMKGFKF